MISCVSSVKKRLSVKREIQRFRRPPVYGIGKHMPCRTIKSIPASMAAQNRDDREKRPRYFFFVPWWLRGKAHYNSFDRTSHYLYNYAS